MFYHFLSNVYAYHVLYDYLLQYVCARQNKRRFLLVEFSYVKDKIKKKHQEINLFIVKILLLEESFFHTVDFYPDKPAI